MFLFFFFFCHNCKHAHRCAVPANPLCVVFQQLWMVFSRNRQDVSLWNHAVKRHNKLVREKKQRTTENFLLHSEVVSVENAFLLLSHTVNQITLSGGVWTGRPAVTHRGVVKCSASRLSGKLRLLCCGELTGWMWSSVANGREAERQ